MTIRYPNPSLLSMQLSHNDYQTRKYMPALDGVRAIAVALVITVHLHKRMWGFLAGNVGVTIFFVLSGYLITRLMLSEEDERGRIGIMPFYIRRAFRIFPLYYFVLAMYTILILWLRLWPDKVFGLHRALPYYLTYFQEVVVWRWPISGNLPFYHSWSLGIEEKFYVCFPLLIAATSRFSRLRITIVAISALACILQALYYPGNPYHMESYGIILLGVLLALLLSRPTSYFYFIRYRPLLSLSALAVALITQFYLLPHTTARNMESVYAMAIAVLMGSLATSRGLANRIFSWSPLVFVGKLSYGIYLVHILCLGLVEHICKPGYGYGVGIMAYLATIVVSAGVAYLLHITLELPMIRRGRDLSQTAFHWWESRSSLDCATAHRVSPSAPR